MPQVKLFVEHLCGSTSSSNYYCTILIKGFYDDINGGTFGTMKKGVKRPLSNFNFEFQTKIISANPTSTGYLVGVIAEYLKSEFDSDSEHVVSG